MIRPKFWAKVNICGSTFKPMWPARIPAKNTNVTPSESPLMRTRPSIKPTAQMVEMTTTACNGDGVR